jgi:predicted peroxiredoxin
MTKTVFVCNGSEPKNLYPTFILASSAIASGDEVILFFTPGGGPALKKGMLEEIKGKGMPDMADLVEGVESLGAKIYLCELALEAKDLKEDEIRESVEIIGATNFISMLHDAQVTFSF